MIERMDYETLSELNLEFPKQGYVIICIETVPRGRDYFFRVWARRVE